MPDTLELRTVRDLLGKNFRIADYQRGYRWTSLHVNDLLDDIWEYAISKDTGNFYCLQPLVVRKRENEDTWDVIDGQQRLTTIRILLTYYVKKHLRLEKLTDEAGYDNDIYTLIYETRDNCEQFLDNITENRSNIDFYYIWKAYNTIQEWFEGGSEPKDRGKREKFFYALLGTADDEKSVRVIWYENYRGKAEDLFNRLNVGKIPLTNAELIKALYFSKENLNRLGYEDSIALSRRAEIAVIWDEIEKKLGDEDFWAFITNIPYDMYQCKIELIFDFIAGKNIDKADYYNTFHWFVAKSELTEQKDNVKNTESLWKCWIEIEKTYETLKEWYEDKNFYHKIGFLVCIGKRQQDMLCELLTLSQNNTRIKLDKILDEKISAVLNCSAEGIHQLTYLSNRKKLETVLLLFNIESLRNSKNLKEHYSFYHHKNENWSLEHIHAQRSAGLDPNNRVAWMKWLNIHKNLLESWNSIEIDREDTRIGLLNDIAHIDLNSMMYERDFLPLQEKIVDYFSETGAEDQEINIHGVGNLALLSSEINSVLSNAVFDEKRRLIIEMDKKGKFIPICTRYVFLKYYTTDSGNSSQNYFWGKEDQKKYTEAITNLLTPYLKEDIDDTSEEDDDEQ